METLARNNNKDMPVTMEPSQLGLERIKAGKSIIVKSSFQFEIVMEECVLMKTEVKLALPCYFSANNPLITIK